MGCCFVMALLLIGISGCEMDGEPNSGKDGPAMAEVKHSPGQLAGRVPAPNQLGPEQALAELKAENDLYWKNARKEVYKNVLEILAQQQAELQRGLQYDKLIRGDPQKKQIALTFDDGPHPGYTPQILALLKQFNVRATFFLVGCQAEKYPELVRAEMAAGHSIGNHTYHHVSLPKIPEEYVADEIKTCGEVLRSITGEAPHLFRPPGGEYDTQVAETAEALGYTTVLWTDDPGDYASPGEGLILSRTLRDASNGGIILIHDGIQQTVDVLPEIIEALRKQGYQFVTIDELLAPAGGRPRPDPRSRPSDLVNLPMSVPSSYSMRGAIPRTLAEQ
jgi:peptidoglycan-N-acetylglucosamine deacetylase